MLEALSVTKRHPLDSPQLVFQLTRIHLHNDMLYDNRRCSIHPRAIHEQDLLVGHMFWAHMICQGRTCKKSLAQVLQGYNELLLIYYQLA